jgi:hypothetical protein
VAGTGQCSLAFLRVNKWTRTGSVMCFTGFEDALMAGFDIFYRFTVLFPAVCAYNPHAPIN